MQTEIAKLSDDSKQAMLCNVHQNVISISVEYLIKTAILGGFYIVLEHDSRC